MKQKVIEQIKENKLIVIVRGVYGEDCIKLAKALYAGGIKMMEITFDQKNPNELYKTADAIKAIKQEMAGKMLVGAGTVLTTEQLDLSRDAGAEFIISPNIDKEIIQKTVEYGLVSIPGALTPTEATAAYNWGADFVKLFPVSNFGSSYVKAVSAPLSHIPFLAVGGVSETNIKDFLNDGAVGAGVGGKLVNKEWISGGEFDKITALAQTFIKNINS